jgi:hypothetical protein
LGTLSVLSLNLAMPLAERAAESGIGRSDLMGNLPRCFEQRSEWCRRAVAGDQDAKPMAM